MNISPDTQSNSSKREPLQDFHELLQLAHDQRASGIFAIPGEPPCLRSAEGGIQRLDRAPLTESWLKAVCAQIAGPELSRVGGEVGEITRWYDLPGVTSARCAIARSSGQLSLFAARVPSVLPTPERAFIPQALLDAVARGWGLVVFGGMSGSGKTTSALSILEHLNATLSCHICTVEDPIEVRFEPKRAVVQQRQVGLDIPNTVAGIRASMRQDPDVLFIGEVKNVEELQAAFIAAAAGHLVFTQLNAANVREVIRRMVDAFPDDMRASARRNLAQVLTAISVQRLLPRIQEGERRGRIPAYELLLMDDETRELIAAGQDPMKRTTPAPEGQTTMENSLRKLHEQGEIDDDALRSALRVNRGRL